MRRLGFLALTLALALGGLALPGSAQAAGKTSVTWTRIDLPAAVDGSVAFEKNLKKLLAKAARKANFGKVKKLSLAVKVVTFTSEQKGDVHRVSCTIVGRIPGGPSVRSHISFGGLPANKAKLEKQVLNMVASAVVTRLAEIVRARAAKAAAAEKAAQKEAKGERAAAEASG